MAAHISARLVGPVATGQNLPAACISDARKRHALTLVPVAAPYTHAGFVWINFQHGRHAFVRQDGGYHVFYIFEDRVTGEVVKDTAPGEILVQEVRVDFRDRKALFVGDWLAVHALNQCHMKHVRLRFDLDVLLNVLRWLEASVQYYLCRWLPAQPADFFNHVAYLD